MRSKFMWLVAVAAAGVLAVSATAIGGESKTTGSMHQHSSHATGARTLTASDLRVTLNRLLGEHMYLAVAASQRGLQGGKEFPALAKALDQNSVELSKAIGLVFGNAAANQFLNGKFLWRAHIGFFVDYTVAVAKKDMAGQKKAVNNLLTYVGAFSNFLSKATGLPQKTLAKGITEHVMQLKGQIDAYATGDYAKSYRLTRAGYHHMGMTGDALAAAIAKKFPGKFK